MTSLLLDEMYSGTIAEQPRAKGYDVLTIAAVVADPALIGLSDDQFLAHATDVGRALVTANIKDFMPLDARYRAASQTHAGLILVSTKTFPQDRNITAAIIGALSTLLGQPSPTQSARFSSYRTGSPPASIRTYGNNPRGDSRGKLPVPSEMIFL